MGIVAVGTEKGGTGKSTATANFASALAQDGHNVGIYDADPKQGSIYYWGLYRRAKYPDLPAIPIYRGDLDIDELEERHDVLLLDLQGANTDRNRHLIRFHADAWLIPYKPTSLDMDNAQATTLALLQKLRPERPDIAFNIFLNEAPTNSQVPEKSARAYLESEYGDPGIILDTVIRRRQPYVDCMGLGLGVAEMAHISNLASVAKARDEFLELYGELTRIYGIGGLNPSLDESSRIKSGNHGLERMVNA